MDIGEATKSEVFRPLATVAIPGAVAVAPYIVVAQHYIPRVLEFWKEHDTAFSAIVVACMLAAGLMLENIGSLIEGRVFDRVLERRFPGHGANWQRYLQLRIRDEYVGQRYLRNVVTHLKFELAMLPSIVCLWIGLAWIQAIHKVWKGYGFLLLSFFMFAVVTYLVFEAYSSAKALGSTRKLLIDAVDNAPAPQDAG
jgi:hypothetical protein